MDILRYFWINFQAQFWVMVIVYPIALVAFLYSGSEPHIAIVQSFGIVLIGAFWHSLKETYEDWKYHNSYERESFSLSCGGRVEIMTEE